MGETTGIAWTDCTFNPWWGCTKVSAGCDHCYAETFDHRLGGKHWGAGAERRTFGAKHWNEPRRWNAAAEKAGKRARVFCASMADVFDAEAPEGELAKLWELIRETPWLDWQLLTKRPHRIAQSLPEDWGDGYANVWLGATVENQEQADLRIPRLLRVPARVRFLSCEPLLGPVDLRYPAFNGADSLVSLEGLHWVIVGGESGGGARPFDLAWARSLLQQCRAAGVPAFFKQAGARSGTTHPCDGACDQAAMPCGGRHWTWNRLADRKGGDWSEWPADLRVRQFPEVSP